MQNGKTEPFEDKITIVKIKTMAIVHELEKNQTIFLVWFNEYVSEKGFNETNE